MLEPLPVRDVPNRSVSRQLSPVLRNKIQPAERAARPVLAGFSSSGLAVVRPDWNLFKQLQVFFQIPLNEGFFR